MEESKSTKKEKIARYKDRQSKFHDLASNQLSLTSNLLLTLSIGFLAFTFNKSAVPNIYINKDHDIDWSVVTYLISLLSVSLSVLLGITVLYSRHYDFRITANIIRVRRKVFEKFDAKLPEASTVQTKISFYQQLSVFFSIVFVRLDLIRSEKDIDGFTDDKKGFINRFKKMLRTVWILGSISLLWTKIQGLAILVAIISFVMYLVID